MSGVQHRFSNIETQMKVSEISEIIKPSEAHVAQSEMEVLQQGHQFTMRLPR